ncbi:MAG: ATP-binding protein [Syntrophobacteraceae bacterium]|nr:ATP-binding protein [Syntrophobacteraceae bacterium]
MDKGKRELNEILSQGEMLQIEFKSDLKCLSDRELVAAVGALAHTEGGRLFPGVEDDGTVTGLHANHLDAGGLLALIANRTNPSLAVQIELLESGEYRRGKCSCPQIAPTVLNFRRTSPAAQADGKR